MFSRTVSVDSTINLAHQHVTNATLPENDTGGIGRIKNPTDEPSEPAGHGLGRSRGGLSTEIHHAVGGRGRPSRLSSHQDKATTAGCCPTCWTRSASHAWVGAASITPDTVLGDNSYSSRATRTLLRGRGIVAVIPEPRDQRANRQRRGSRGGRHVTYDHDTTRAATSSNAPSCTSNNGGAWPPATTSPPSSTAQPSSAQPSSSPPPSPGYDT